MPRSSGTSLLVCALLIGQAGCRPPTPTDTVPEQPEPTPEQPAPIPEQPEPPPSPSPEPPPPELRFVRWRGEGVDLRLTHVEIARRHAAIVECLTPATKPDKPLMVHLGGTASGPPRTLVGLAVGPADDALIHCVRRELAGIELLDEAGDPVRSDQAWLELTIVVDPNDADLRPAVETERVRVDVDNRCLERHESPCAPNKSCMPDFDLEVVCPTNAGLATPTHEPASTVMLVWNETPTSAASPTKRIVAQRWNHLCSLDLREPPTSGDVFEIVRAGPIPCAVLDSLLADAKAIDRALGKRLPPPNPNTTQIEAHVNRLEPKWSAVRILHEWAAPLDLLPEPYPHMQATLEAAIDRWTIATSAT